MSSSHRISPVLLMVEGDAPGRLFELNRHSTTIGRNPVYCEVVLNEPEISRRHARIVREERGSYTIKDLGSRCGTQVNEKNVVGPCPLKDGDVIRVWNYVLRYQDNSVRLEEDSDHGSTILRVRDLLHEDSRRSTKGAGPGGDLRQKFDALVEISQGIFHSLDLQEVLETTLASLFEVFPWANRGFVLLKDEQTDELVPKAIKTQRADATDLTISQTIVNQVISRGQAVLIRDAAMDSRLPQTESIRISRVRTVMCVPLIDRSRKPIGLIQLDTLNPSESFSQEDHDLMVVVSGFVSVAVENAGLHAKMVKRTAKEAEEDNARRIQRLFLPKARPRLAGYEFWDCYHPAESVGGDYFGYFPLDGEEGKRLAVMIGDVSGKGMPAALIMAKLSAEARLAVTTEADPGKVAERLNAQILQDELEGMFVTLLIAWVDATDHRVSFVRAGHLAPLVRRKDGRVEVVGDLGGGPPLGLVRNRSYVAESFDLGPGDHVLFYTDGVTEAQDATGDLFGNDRLRQVVRAAPLGAPGVGKAVLQAVRDHGGRRGPSDDLTLICFGRP